MGSGCGEPQYLAQSLEERLRLLSDLEILHILSVGKPRFTCGGNDQCRLKSFFVAAASREAVAEGRADYTPINLVDIPGLFRSGAMTIDVALIQVSAPDDHGFCSYGVAVDIVKPAAESARHIIAQVNPRMPRTLGDSFIHVSHIDAFVEHEEPLLEFALPIRNQIAIDIGRHVAGLVEDGSTIRVGVGSISTAALYALEGKKDLGVHADMLTDAYLHLVKKGVITNARKTLHPGKIVASFCLGSQELYEFVDNNPMVALYPIDYTNNYLVISENDKMVTINSGLEVDLSGQVCSDSLGYEIYSGVGGATDFLRGARGSRGGKTIMVLPSINHGRIEIQDRSGPHRRRRSCHHACGRAIRGYRVRCCQPAGEEPSGKGAFAYFDSSSELQRRTHGGRPQDSLPGKGRQACGDKPGHLSARLGIFAIYPRSSAAYSSGRQRPPMNGRSRSFSTHCPKMKPISGFFRS